MNGVHDLGGMDGFGRVEVEADEPVFHETWERRVLGLTFAMSIHRMYGTDAFRHAIERMEPAHYLTSTYYEHWLTGLATLLIERGVLTRAELEAQSQGRFPIAQPIHPEAVQPAAPSAATPRFAVGDAVAVRNLHPFGHTRCPRYVRGKRGVIVRVDRRSPLPDAAAHGSGKCQQYAYNVRFDGEDLWGKGAGAATTVHVDLWEGYLEAP